MFATPRGVEPLRKVTVPLGMGPALLERIAVKVTEELAGTVAAEEVSVMVVAEAVTVRVPALLVTL